MDRNWNRNSGGGGATGGEKMYGRQSYSSGGVGHYHQQSNHYRKKNDYSSQDFYSKTVKTIVQPVKKESLQVASVEDELMSANFSWIKNSNIN